MVSGHTFSVSGSGTFPSGPKAYMAISITAPDGQTINETTIYNDDQLAAPTTPTFTVGSDGTSVTLSWTDTSSDDHTGFQIEEENVTAGDNWVLVCPEGADSVSTDGGSATLGRTADTATIGGLLASPTVTTEYEFRVVAVSQGEAAVSGSADVTAEPQETLDAGGGSGVTVSLAYGYPENTQTAEDCTVSWSPVTDANQYIIEYQEESPTLSETDWQGFGSVGSDATSLTVDEFCFPDQTFEFRVIAVASDGSVSAPMTGSLTGSGTPEWDSVNHRMYFLYATGNPGDIHQDRGLLMQDGAIIGTANFDWAFFDGEELPYLVYPSLAANQSSSFTLVSNETDLVDGALEMSYPTTTSLTGTPAAPTIPAAPSNLNARTSQDDDDSDGDDDSVNLAWDDNSKNETGFKILESIDGGAFVQIDQVGADQNWATEPMPGGNVKSVAFEVESFNAAGVSPPSNNATPSAPVVNNWKIDGIGAQMNFGAEDPFESKFETSISSTDKDLMKRLINAAEEVGGEVIAKAEGAIPSRRLSVDSVQINIYASGTVSRDGKPPAKSSCEIKPEVGPIKVNGVGDWWTVEGATEIANAFAIAYKQLQERDALIRKEIQDDLIANTPK